MSNKTYPSYEIYYLFRAICLHRHILLLYRLKIIFCLSFNDQIIIMIFNFGTVLRKSFEKMRKWKFSILFSILINAEKTLKIPSLRNEISPYVKPINEVLRKFFLGIENSHSFSQYYEKPLETQDVFNETTFVHWEFSQYYKNHWKH